MPLNTIETLIIIGVIALGTLVTRFLPFLLFPEKKEPPKFITYLGKMLPVAMMGMLVVYCLKGTTVITYPYALPELISIVVIVVLHKFKKNTLLSIGVGTILYMVLVQFVF